MIVISKAAIKEFIVKHPISAGALLEWYILVKESNWSDYHQLKTVFRSADSVGNDLYVFNIAGNKYRLIARIIFKVRTVFIRFVGTHAEYDRINLSKL